MSLLNGALHPSLPPGQFAKREGARKSWMTCQLLAQEFWLKWQKVYLLTLIPHAK